MEEVKQDFLSKLKGFAIFVVLFLGYMFVPQIVGVYMYKAYKLSESVSMFIGNVSYVLIVISIYHEILIMKIKDFFKNFGKYFGDSLKYWGIGLLVMFVSNLILAYLVFPGEISANEDLNRASILASPIIGFISVVFLAPFIEEMIFRFGLRKGFPKTKFFPLITAILFGLPHTFAGMSLSASLGTNLLQLLYVIPYGALGYAFGYAYMKSDNIFSSIMCHMLHNFMCFVVIVSFV